MPSKGVSIFCCCPNTGSTDITDEVVANPHPGVFIQVPERSQVPSTLNRRSRELQLEKELKDANEKIQILQRNLSQQIEVRDTDTKGLRQREEDTSKSDNELQQLRRDLSQQKSIISTREEELKQIKAEINEKAKELEQKNEVIEKLTKKVQELEKTQPATTSEIVKDEKDGKKSKKRPVIYPSDKPGNFEAKKTSKEDDETQFLLKAIQSNDLLKHHSSEQISEMIDYMESDAFPQDHVLINEGDDGDRFFILQSGKCRVTQRGKFIATMEEGVLFGEIAIFHGCKRTATVTAGQSVKVWYLLRTVYQEITKRAAKGRYEEIMEFVKSCKKLKITKRDNLNKIARAVNEEGFNGGDYIVRQGEVGRTFYIIKEGEVDVTQNSPSHVQYNGETWIRVLKRGDYFGEGALLNKRDVRGANVIAKTAKVVCYSLDEDSFKQLIGDAANVNWEGDEAQLNSTSIPIVNTNRLSNISVDSTDKSMENISLQDLNFIAILGSGGFGRVELVRVGNRDGTYALKCMKKIHIVETKQEDHVYSEKKIMLNCHSDFIVRLYRTFKNKKYVYMLMEACLGGELWKHLRDSKKFSDNRSKFYTACVVEALDYLHKKKILYRDLKPENLLLDKSGYVKLVDFGFAKRLDFGERTWTFCGTPQYVAPEIILNQGHDESVDYWALGILVFEFLTGNPPFDSVDQMRTYRMIVRGIDAIEFPVYIKKPAQNLIKRLCRETPSDRLGNLKGGFGDIKQHKWFSGFDWAGLRQRTLQPDFIPVVNGDDDTGNFDKFDRHMSQDKAPSELSGWDCDY